MISWDNAHIIHANQKVIKYPKNKHIMSKDS